MLYALGVLLAALVLSAGWFWYWTHWLQAFKPESIVAAIISPIFMLFGGWAAIGTGVIIAFTAKIVGS